MPSTIYKEIVEHRARTFIDRFMATRKWFHDELSRNHLFHAGEFGASRESSVRTLLKGFVGSQLSLSHGFIINGADQHTRQCDVVVYDSTRSPLLDDATGFRCFFAESAVAIGEVKSVMTKSKLKDALLTLARNKMIRDHYASIHLHTPEHVSLVSFLVCEQIQGFEGNIGSWANDVYAEHAIPAHAQHNLLLSIQDGVVTHRYSDTKKLALGNHSKGSDLIEPIVLQGSNAVANVTLFIRSFTKALRMAKTLPFFADDYEIEE